MTRKGKPPIPENVNIRRIDKSGRLTIPKEFLEDLMIYEGDNVFLSLEKDRISIFHLSDGFKVFMKEKPKTRRSPGSPVKKVAGDLTKKGEPRKRRPKAMKTAKFNEKWAYEQRQKNKSLQDMKEAYEEEMGIEIDRTAFSRWITEYESEK
jgi:bifunctional DNA-binding transcriptional regulator/antitoxin component of YhaV-PrlF toxin-antitoxin module